jgi:predicted transcriptional regulator
MIAGMSQPVRNFHLPLPEPLYRRLRDAAERTNQPATALARYAIDAFLRQQRKAMVREAIAAYAADVAGSRDDLDERLESAGLEALREERGPAKRTRRKR